VSGSTLKSSARWVKAAVMADFAELFGSDPVVLETIGRFELLRAAGRGAHGQVWEARDPVLDRKVAIKLPRRRGSLEQQLAEAKAAGRVGHPNLVEIYDVGVHDGDVWIAMEWIDGITLREWNMGPRSWRDRVAVVRGIAEGLSALHRAGVVHCDIKPDNVMIEASSGRAVVTDFGLAGDVDGLGPVFARGTPGYRAPEVEEGVVSVLSDQFSFGVLVGETLGRGIPAQARRVGRRARSKNPDRRWRGGMDEVVSRLGRGGLALSVVSTVVLAMLMASACGRLGGQGGQRLSTTLSVRAWRSHRPGATFLVQGQRTGQGTRALPTLTSTMRATCSRRCPPPLRAMSPTGSPS